MRTCRELYDFITGLPASPRPLEEYLRALLALARAHGDRAPFCPDDFAALLEKAYAATPAIDLTTSDGDAPFARWERCVVRQIRDLRGMDADGKLVDRDRYFGVDMPSGARWYNFTPDGFLERGCAGKFGECDDELGLVDWDEFRSFLVTGECYE